MDTETKALHQKCDEVALAEARQTAAYLRILGIEEEIHEAFEAWLRLDIALHRQHRDACAVWRDAKDDVAEANRRFTGMFRP